VTIPAAVNHVAVGDFRRHHLVGGHERVDERGHGAPRRVAVLRVHLQGVDADHGGRGVCGRCHEHRGYGAAQQVRQAGDDHRDGAGRGCQRLVQAARDLFRDMALGLHGETTT